MNYFTALCGFTFNTKILDRSGIYFGVKRVRIPLFPQLISHFFVHNSPNNPSFPLPVPTFSLFYISYYIFFPY